MTTRARSSFRVVLLTLLTWLTTFAAAAPAPRARHPQRQLTPVDRTLHVRSLPAVNGLSSSVYEVLMQPYNFEVPALTAVAEMGAAGAGEAEAGPGGKLMLSQPHPPVGPLLVRGNLSGLPAGRRLALQVRRWGDLSDGCDAAAVGPHFDPFMVYGVLEPPGNVGVVSAGVDGSAQVRLASGMFALAGPHSVLGRALVLRTLPDALREDGTAVACGVVALARFHPPPAPQPQPPSQGAAAPQLPHDGVEMLDRP